MTTPYENATSGVAAREEITKLLRRFGCESVGFLDDYEKHEVLLAFRHRGRQMQLRASAKGWAALYLKEHPYSYRIKRSEKAHREAALAQGQIAVNSILRDWVRGQIMAIETGILSFDAVFMPYMLTNDGRTLSERVDQLGLLGAPSS
ncbi:hypothetical protein [Bradyrhizobium sp. USDA 10063]